MTTNSTRPTGNIRRSAGTPRMRRVRRGSLGQDGEIDYKDAGAMRRFVNERGKIASPRRTGASAKSQRELAIAVKRARHLALIPFAPHHKHMTDSVQESSPHRDSATRNQPAVEGPPGPTVAPPSGSASQGASTTTPAAATVESDASHEESADVEQTDA